MYTSYEACLEKMKDREQEILRLLGIAMRACDAVKQAAASRAENWLVEDAANTKTQFEKMANQVRAATLQPSGGGGLGITRALGESAPSDLYAAGQAVEDFYMRHW